MDYQEIDLIKTSLLNPTMRAFVEKQPNLSEFSHFYSKDLISQQLNNLDFKPSQRAALFEQLKIQYANVSCPSPSSLKLLKDDNTYTVTTGHQLSFLTGPSYTIYKIASVIALAKKMNIEHPNNQFVPVFWLASEDHDFKEVSSVNLFNENFPWDSGQKGAVGRMLCSEQKPVLDAFFEKLNLSNERETELRESLKSNNLSNQYIQLIHLLFKAYPELIILDADASLLKSEFSPIIKRELTERASFDLIHESSDKLNQLGYKTQINPRKINLFYLRNELRERIVFENNLFKVLNSDLEFTLDQIMKEVDEFPERFSPNVALRPIYQQKILPNIAYIGGGGELTYWHQLKSSFSYYKVHFPILCLRDSFIFLKEKQMKKWNSFGFETIDLFFQIDELIKSFVKKNSDPISFEKEQELANQMFDLLQEKALKIDPSLTQSMSAEKTKLEKSITNIISRFEKSNKRKHDIAIGQITKIKETVFPQNSFQERVDSIWSQLANEEDIIDKIVKACDCTENKIKLITN